MGDDLVHDIDISLKKHNRSDVYLSNSVHCSGVEGSLARGRRVGGGGEKDALGLVLALVGDTHTQMHMQTYNVIQKCSKTLIITE